MMLVCLIQTYSFYVLFDVQVIFSIASVMRECDARVRMLIPTLICSTLRMVVEWPRGKLNHTVHFSMIMWNIWFSVTSFNNISLNITSLLYQ